MKPFLSKILIAALACMMVLPAASCAKNEEGAESTTASGEAGSTGAQEEVTTQYMPDIAKTNYDAELNVICANGFLAQYAFPSKGEEEPGSLDSELVERATRMKDHLGVELVRIDEDRLKYAQLVNRSVQAGDDAYQMVITHAHNGMSTMLAANSLYDLQELPAVNLQAPYWAQDAMESMKMQGRYLLGYHDFMLSDAHIVAFNKDMLKEHQLEEPYDLVRNKQWTLEKLITMSSGISEDVNNDGLMDQNDKYGLSGWGWVPLIDFMTSSDIQMVSQDETGYYTVAYDRKKDRVLDLIDRVYGVYNAESSFFWKSVENGDDTKRLAMDSGRSLFGLLPVSELIRFRDSDIRLGLLPYPLYDENQSDYHSLNWNGMFCVPSTVKNPQMVGESIEMLGAYSQDVRVAFYEKLLKLKLSEAPDDAEMLDIISDSLICDVGLCLCDEAMVEGNVYMIAIMCEKEGPNYASYSKKNAGPANKSLKSFVRKMEKNMK